MAQTPLQDGKPKDPRAQGPRPDYPQKPIAPPGLDAEMTPRADHGEQSYRGLGRLEHRVALITGGDSGIGRAVAIAFSREGADVAISYLPEEQPDAEETRRWIEEAGRRALLLPGDIRDERHCGTLIDRTFAQLGPLDILVNNAAFQMTHDDITEFSTEEFDRTFKTNVYAMFWLCRAAVPRMTPGSVIINTASIQAYDPSPNLLAYASTKGAIVNFTKALSKMAMPNAPNSSHMKAETPPRMVHGVHRVHTVQWVLGSRGSPARGSSPALTGGRAAGAPHCAAEPDEQRRARLSGCRRAWLTRP